jgi:hypothetical protein
MDEKTTAHKHAAPLPLPARHGAGGLVRHAIAIIVRIVLSGRVGLGGSGEGNETGNRGERGFVRELSGVSRSATHLHVDEE